MWSIAKSFSDLLDLSKNALIKGKENPFSGTSDKTNNMLVEASMPYMDDFIKMHDLGFMTLDSQPGTIEHLPNKRSAEKITDDFRLIHIFSDIPTNECIRYQREYVSGLIEKSKITQLIDKLKKNPDITMRCASYWDENIVFCNKPEYDINESLINLTKYQTQHLIEYSANEWLNGADFFSLLESEISKVLFRECMNKLVYISFIKHEYGTNDLNQTIINLLKEIK